MFNEAYTYPIAFLLFNTEHIKVTQNLILLFYINEFYVINCFL